MTYTELHGLAAKYDTDKLTHGFIDIYVEHFKGKELDIRNMLEIGVHKGQSLRMWRDHFKLAEIEGWDINSYEPGVFGPRTTTKVVNQESPEEIIRATTNPDGSRKMYDIILDDGGHTMAGQQLSLAYLWPCLLPGGTFIVEDLHTSLPHNPYEWAGGKCLPNFSNSSLLALYGLQDTGKIKSVYMTSEQTEMLSSECVSCRVYDTKGDERHITSILIKRK